MGGIADLKRKVKDGSIRKRWQEWKWIMQYTKAYKGPITLYVLLSLLGVLLGLAGSVASKNLIDGVTGFQRAAIGKNALLLGMTVLLGLLLYGVTASFSVRINLRIQQKIQQELFGQILQANWLSLSSFHSGDIRNRFDHDSKVAASSAIGWLPQFITEGFRIVTSLGLIFYYDGGMALIALIHAPLMLAVSRSFLKHLRSCTENVREAESQMSAFQEETFSNIELIKSCSLTEHFAKGLRQEQRRYQDAKLAYSRCSVQSSLVMQFLGIFAGYTCFGWGIYRLWTGRITFGEMTLFLSQAGRLATSFRQAASLVPSMIGAMVSAGRLMELICLPGEKNKPQSDELCLPTGGLHLALEQVEFGYTGKQKVFEHVSLRADPGEIVAVVGASGEGKTTLLRILLGLLVPRKGQAVIRDEDGRDWKAGTLPLTAIAYVPQKNILFSGTIAENLSLVKEGATREEMQKALREACADNFVENMPKGMESRLGAGGFGVSEGQAQRIAIARALLLDAPILLLDEATSALDAKTEGQVLARIMKQNPKKTCIITTHRREVLSVCQRVYRVEGGVVAELGREEVMEAAVDF